MTTTVMTKTMEILTERLTMMTIKTAFHITIMEIIPLTTRTMTTTVMTKTMEILTERMILMIIRTTCQTMIMEITSQEQRR